MKKISEHLGQIIVALCGIVLCVCAIVVFRADIGAFFNNIVGKETGVGNQLLDGVNNPDFAITVDYERPVITLDQDLSEESNNPTSVAGSVSNGTYALSGKVADNAGVQSVTVNGTEVSVAADGTWSTAIAIAQNETKEIAIVATDISGNKATKTVHIANIEYTNFTITESNRVKVGYTGAENEELVIPATFYDEADGKWYKVTCINAQAFMDCTNLMSVTIPDSVTTIGFNAFLGCTNLALVELPSGLTSIEGNTFENCTNLTSITIPDSVTSIGNYAFYFCTNLALTELPSGLKSIGSSAFQNCDNLVLTELPSGVTSIGQYAFFSCDKLESITIPDSVTSIDKYAFSDCTNLVSVSLPSGSTVISGNLFKGCTNLTSVTIPDSVTSIVPSAFSGCTSLTNITIPAGVTSIGKNAFESCTNLTEIKFLGTVEQWNAITFGAGWNKSVPTTQVVCSDGTVNL